MDSNIFVISIWTRIFLLLRSIRAKDIIVKWTASGLNLNHEQKLRTHKNSAWHYDVLDSDYKLYQPNTRLLVIFDHRWTSSILAYSLCCTCVCILRVLFFLFVALCLCFTGSAFQHHPHHESCPTSCHVKKGPNQKKD